MNSCRYVSSSQGKFLKVIAMHVKYRTADTKGEADFIVWYHMIACCLPDLTPVHQEQGTE